MNYEENFTPLRDLKPGDQYIDKANSEGIYLSSLGNDRHLVKHNTEFEVPRGGYPVFKKIFKFLIK